MTQKWPPPVYKIKSKLSFPHYFICACIVRQHRELGRGTTKRIARRSAAYKMCIELQENLLDETQIFQVLDEDVEDIEVRVTGFFVLAMHKLWRTTRP